MKTCILIGGGNTTDKEEPYETEVIDKRIVKETGKDNPTFLYIGFANSHSDSKYDQTKKLFQEYGCKTEYLKKKNVINNPKLAEEKIKRADIIYIGGGDTIKLLETIEEYHLEPYLKEAYERGCVMAGKSAGAILLSKEGFSDSYILRGEKDKYCFVKGLSFTDLSIVPHYKEDEKKTEDLKEELKGTKKEVIGIENGTALLVKDKKIEGIISMKNKHIYKISNQKDYQEEVIF